MNRDFIVMLMNQIGYYILERSLMFSLIPDFSGF